MDDSNSFLISLDWIKQIYTALKKISKYEPIIHAANWSEDWMASGLEIKFDPSCSDGETSYQFSIVSIFDYDGKQTIVKPIRATIRNIINHTVVEQIEHVYLSIEEIENFWIKYQNLEQNLIKNIPEFNINID